MEQLPLLIFAGPGVRNTASAGTSVFCVPKYRMAEVGKMSPYLVCLSCDKADLQQGYVKVLKYAVP